MYVQYVYYTVVETSVHSLAKLTVTRKKSECALVHEIKIIKKHCNGMQK